MSWRLWLRRMLKPVRDTSKFWSASVPAEANPQKRRRGKNGEEKGMIKRIKQRRTVKKRRRRDGLQTLKGLQGLLRVCFCWISSVRTEQITSQMLLHHNMHKSLSFNPTHTFRTCASLVSHSLLIICLLINYPRPDFLSAGWRERPSERKRMKVNLGLLRTLQILQSHSIKNPDSL